MYKVLLVEDDPSNRFLYKHMKEWKDMEFEIVAEATDGLEALRQIERQDFHMILVDVIMPNMNGLDLLRELEKQKNSACRIIASGYNEFEYVRQGMRHGAMDYLLKPIEGKELKQCLMKVRDTIKAEEETHLVEEVFSICGADVHAGFVQKLMEYFKNHQDIALTEVAEEFQLSKDYFGKLFKLQMNENFNPFVQRYKMELAKKLLASYDYKIYEISEQLGYKTTDYFSKLFREYTNETPLQYRKNHT